MTSPIPAGGDEIGELVARLREAARYIEHTRVGLVALEAAAALTAANARISALEAQAAASVEADQRLLSLLRMAQDGAGTLPARASVKLRPPHWHALEDAIRIRSSNGGRG